LHAAQQAIISGDYRGAEAHARAILATAKSSPQAYQAQFILAQSLYGQGKPQDAAIAFDDAYNRNHTGDYAPQSLLGLANSLTAIHQEAAACDTLASLNSQFPTPPAGLGPHITAAEHRAHCS
jgi:TolA-binding protein